MNNKNLIVFLKIFFILFFFIENSLSTIVLNDVSPINTPYSKYVSNTNGYCSFNFFILNSNDDGTNTGTDSLTNSNTISYTAVYNKLQANLTSTLYNVTLSSVMNSSTSYTLTLYSGSTSKDIVFSCFALDTNSLSIQLVNNMAFPYIVGSQKQTLIKISGLNPNVLIDKNSIKLSCESPYTCSVSQNGYTNYFYLYFLGALDTDDYSNPLKLNVSSYKSSMIVTLSTNLFGGYFDDISNITLYPPSQYSSSVVYNSINSKMIFKFTSNLTNDQRMAFEKLSLVTSQYGGYVPIKSSNGLTTFIGCFDSLTGNTQTLSLYNLKGYKYSQIFNTTYTLSKTWTVGNIASSYSYTNLQTFSKYNLLTVQFSGTNYDTIPLIIRCFSNLLQNYNNYAPYGFVSGNNTNYNYRISVPITMYNNNSFQTFQIQYPNKNYITYTFAATYPVDRTLKPNITSYELIHLDGIDFIVRIKIISTYGVKDLNQYLVSGDIYNGVYEQIVTPWTLQTSSLYYRIMDYANLVNTYYFDTLITMNPITFFSTDRFYDSKVKFDPYNIQTVSFLLNDIDVTNQTIYNSMYFNYSSEVPRNTPFVLYFYGEDAVESSWIYQLPPYLNSYTAFWNDTIQLFQIDFVVPANAQESNYYPFVLIVNRVSFVPSYSLPQENQLRVKSSTYDNYGPVFKTIRKSSGYSIDSNSGTQKLGWSFEIEDETNGLKGGYIVVKGSSDNSIYNFTIEPSLAVSGDQYNGVYDIYVNVSSPCASQSLIITDVILYDNHGKNSTFTLTTFSGFGNSGYLNPFINYLNDSSINTVSYTCASTIVDSTGPYLVSFNISRSSIDVGSTDRIVTILLEARDDESDLKKDQNPIVYISDISLNLISCPTTQASKSTNGYVYNCTVEIPLGMGYPFGLFASVYGIINQVGLYTGYSIDLLKANSNFNYFISTSDKFSMDQPIISRNKKISTKDTKLWLYGKGFTNVESVQVYYHLDKKETINITTIDTLYSSAVAIYLSKQTYNPFYVTLVTKDGIKSNQYLINPYYYPIPNFVQPIYQDSSDSTPTTTPTDTPTDTPYNTSSPTTTPTNTPTDIPYNTSSPTETPIPTNAPQLCKGSPKCGGSNQGYCLSTGCVCINGYVGLDCSSKSIQTDQPQINTGPNVQLPTTNTGDLGSTEGNSSTSSEETINNNNIITYKTLVSIVGLREIDISNTQVKYFPFEKWEYKEINQSSSQYNCRIQTSNGLTNVNVTIQWFNKTTTINFADQQLTMNPSTIKYTIELSSYPFSSKLNRLQLIMSASIEASQTDNICSSKEFGDTSSGDNSNYLKVQVEDHSVYGRFIKRAILDSKTTSISNELLDKSLNVLTSSYQSQSFIGINIPTYENIAIIDPDFSVLLDSSSASSNSNSICSKTSSGLAVSKIAGIVIGSVAFVAVIGIVIVYNIRKNKKQSKFLKSLNDKMNPMNS